MHRFGDAGPLAPSRGIGTWSPPVCASECDPECACGCCLLRRLKGGSAVSSHTSWGVPSPKQVGGAAREAGLWYLVFIPQCQSNQKVCWLSERKPKCPQPRGARGRPGCPRRCARCAPLPRLPGGSRRAPAIAGLIPSPICLLLAASEDFSSRPASSLPFTHARAHTSPTPLPPSPGFSGERQLDAMIHLQQSSRRRATPRVPPVRSGLRGSGVDRFWAGSPALRSAAVPPRGVRVPAARTQVPAGALSDTWTPSTPSPLSSNSWPAAAPRPRLQVQPAKLLAARPLPL